MIKEVHLKSLKDEILFALSFIEFEFKEMFYVFVYASLIGILGLATSMSMQFLINSISFTGQTSQVAMLTSITVILLLFISALQILRKIAVEKIEQRVLVRLTLASADNLGFREIKKNDWSRSLVVHRFFDVFNYQVYLSKLLLDGIGLAIVTILGLLFIILYHPILAILAFVILLAFSGIVFLFFRPGIETQHQQSEEKYKLAAWLSFIAESRSLFKRKKSHEYLISQTDGKTTDYLAKRQEHFNVCVWQQGLLYFLQAIGAGVFLGMGGYFVIAGAINLGQLVAMEFVVLGVLYGVSAFGGSLENFYSFVIAAKKLKPLISEPSESKRVQDDSQAPSVNGPLSITISSESLEKTYRIDQGDLVVLKGGDGFARRSLLWNISSTEKSSNWEIQASGIDWTVVSKSWKREEVVLIDRPTVFDVNLSSNILLETQTTQPTSTLKSFNKVPDFLTQVYENYAAGDAHEWADDPRTRLYISFFRAIATESKIILIDYLFDELSVSQQDEFLAFFKQNFKHKMLIVNSCSESLAEHWTQEIKWKQE